MTPLVAVRTRTAFLLGMALSLLPAVGPFLAALLLFSRRWTLERRDLLWAGAAASFGAASAIGGGAVQGLVGLFAVAGPWIVYRSFSELKRLDLAYRRGRALALGLLAGFGVVVVVGLIRSIAALDFGAATTVADAIVWQGSPSLFGHAVLTLGATIALVTREHRRLSWAAMGLAAFGILVSGSIEAAIAWGVLAVLMIVQRTSGGRRPRLVEAFALIAMLVVATGLAPLLGWGQVGFMLSGQEAPDQRNLLAGTEAPRGDWWDDRWVDVATTTGSIGGRELTVFEVRKRGSATWLRLQQLVPLQPATTYTLSAWIDARTDAVPGLQGWGESAPAEHPLVLVGSLLGERWSASVSGPADLIDASVTAHDGAWRRVAVSFRTADSLEPLTWFVGFVPDARTVEGTAGRFAGMMLEVGPKTSPYQPGAPSGGVGFGYGRAPLWRAAWSAIQERPLFGWGPGAFPEAYRTSREGIERQEFLPAHPHNLVLWVLFEHGVVGLLAFGMLLVALFGRAIRQRDLALLSVVLAVLIANLFDATLLSGAVLYPLAAVAGWRSQRRPTSRAEGPERVRQLTVRAVLASTDLIVAMLGTLVANAVADWAGTPFAIDASLMYALLLWPAFAWREGLYPGYGLTPSQELKKQVTAWAYASALLAVGTQLFSNILHLPVAGLVPLIITTLIAGPSGRAAAKRLLHAGRVWGRPVVILGAGTVGRRVARALLQAPLEGLKPMAFFDDRIPPGRGRIEGLRVRGDLDDAVVFARRHGIHHTIVAIPSLDPRRLDKLVSGSGRTFRRVQFVPDLAGIPSQDVIASDLDGMLSIEIKNGLASRLNRSVKRTFDIVAVVLGGLILSPFLLGLMAAVYIDAPGPVFFGHTRIGRGGRRFTTWKFRSMVPDAETVLARHLEKNPELRSEWEDDQKLRHDPRVTRVGRFLRATSLDELPQIWNVLMGEMSLVGPRPIVDAEVPKYGHVFELYRIFRPGITGFWQVSGRNDVSYENRVAMDAHYVRNWSVWLDLVILVRTVAVVVRREGAY